MLHLGGKAHVVLVELTLSGGTKVR